MVLAVALYLASVAAAMGAMLFGTAARYLQRRQAAAGVRGRGHLPAVVLAVALYLASVAAFGAGCWLAVAPADTDYDQLPTVYAARV
ncbi:integral membrane protein [Bordetella pertussis]|nr:integral membrane protein [Bordetella pertussis]